jgi:2-iminobutanoate/2-iminopropanoate deaminase
MADGIEAIYVKNISEFLERNKVPIVPAIKANGFVFVSGAPPIDPDTGVLARGDVMQQTEVIMRYLERVLTAAGTSFDKVVKVTIYAANSAHFRMINEVYAKYFKSHYPTRTFVTVGSWPMEFDVEIECTALA